MQKIIDNIITVILGLVIGSLFFLAVQAKAEPPNLYNEQDRPLSHPVQEKSNVNTAIDDIINLILNQGFAGAIIVCLGFYTVRTDRINRGIHKENFDKLAGISQECSGHMASVSARLENLEREVEQSKQLEMMKRS